MYRLSPGAVLTQLEATLRLCFGRKLRWPAEELMSPECVLYSPPEEHS
jgi:hypothetical protein